MIKMTDNLNMTYNLYEARKFVLSGLIKEGYKYIARDKDGEFYAYSGKPIKLEKEWLFKKPLSINFRKNISLLSFILPDIKWKDKEPFEIPYVDWDNVSVDTKVIVAGVDGSEWKCHFCKKVNDNAILAFRDGKTSWTTDDVVEVDIDNVRLA